MRIITLKSLFLFAIISFVFSCRTASDNEKIEKKDTPSENPPYEDVPSKNVVSIKLNFDRTKWNNNNPQNTQFGLNKSWGGGGKSLINNELAHYTEVLDNGLGAVEITEKPKSIELQSFSSKKEDIPKDATYVVLAYKKAGYDYIFEKEETFVVGNKSEIQLTKNQNYTLVIISTGTSIPPKISEKEIFTEARFKADDNVDTYTRFLYQRIDNFIPNGDINHDLIDLKLKNKTSSVSITLDSSDFMGGDQGGKRMVSIRNPRIIYNRPEKVEVRLSDSEQILSKKSIETETAIEFPGSVSTNIVSNFADNLILENNAEVFFVADISIEGLLEVKTIKFSLKGIKLGSRKEFEIRLARCGAYLGPNNTEWRQFMCHNLGADYGRDPFTPNENIHGDKYQWGYKEPTVKQKDDIYTGRIPNWNSKRKDNTWNKGMDDPCPSGYRVPTKEESDSIMRNNTTRTIGDMKTKTRKVANGGFWVGSNLMLPTAGKIDNEGYANREGSGFITGPRAEYWTSTNSLHHPYNKYVFGYFSGNTDDRDVLDKVPIRCIKKLPNE